MSSKAEPSLSKGFVREDPFKLEVKPPELIVFDELAPCPYLPDATCRIPLRMPVRPLTREEFDTRLQTGHRRQGRLLYRTQCPSCDACEPIRVLVNEFVPGRGQRRVLRKAEPHVDIELGMPVTTRDRVLLYNRHKQLRGLMHGEEPLGALGYEAFLVDTCCDTFEIRFRVQGTMAGVAVVDRGVDSLSAVYTYYDPSYEFLSLGVFSILKQIELCRMWQLRYLYLGLYIERCSRMVYKGRYWPHERLTHGHWQRFDRKPDAVPTNG